MDWMYQSSPWIKPVLFSDWHGQRDKKQSRWMEEYGGAAEEDGVYEGIKWYLVLCVYCLVGKCVFF